MKRGPLAARLAVAAVLGALLALLGDAGRPAAAQLQDPGRILSYEVDIEVERGGEILVSEHIRFDFGPIRRHGIYRDIPVVLPYDDRRDRLYRVEVVSVEGEPGTPDQLQRSREGNLLRLRIGDPDVLVTGLHSYTIVYRVEGALNGFPGHDELYWNAVGTDWSVPIDSASATVRLPGPVERVACFAGPFGSGLRCNQSGYAGPTATFAHDSLGRGEGLTVVVGFPKGIVAEPAPILEERWSFARAFSITPVTWGLFAALTVLMLGIFARLLWVHGRDRRAIGSPIDIAHGTPREGEQRVPLFEPGTHPVEFAPPDDVRPGQVGVLIDERVNPVDITATIVDLAVRGYLRIEEIPKRWFLGKPDWNLVQLKEADGALLPYERMLLEGLFREADDEDALEEDALEEDEDLAGVEGLEGAGTAAARSTTAAGGTSVAVAPPGIASVKLASLKRKFHARYARVERALYADAAKRRWFAARPDRVRLRWTGIGVVTTLLGIALVILAAWKTHLGIVPIPILVGGLVILLGAKWMPRRTARGTGLVRRVLGFRTYIEKAETYEARWAEEENVFSRFLPYAIVFGVTEKWARAFARLGAPPDTAWYAGSRPFTPRSFASSIDDFAVSSAGTISARPASSGSSGFGGGGFSGGGGGGGGGGSW